MRDASLVIDEKRGLYVHYRLNEDTLAAWGEEIEKLLDPAVGAGTDTKGVQRCAAVMTRSKVAKSVRT
jgi:hypothetical protein